MKRKAQSSVFFLWTAGILVCLLAVLLALVLSSCGRGEEVPIVTPPAPEQESVNPDDPEDVATGEPGSTPSGETPSGETPSGETPSGETPSGQTTPSGSGTTPSGPYVLGETADAGQSYIDKLTFLGDSTTYGLKAYSMLSGGQNTTQVWTPSSGTLTLSFYETATIVTPNGEMLIKDAAAAYQPEYLVITLGVNGVSFMDEASFKDCYTKLIQNVQAASPNTKIICNSIYPNMTSYKYYGDINNENITRANGWIQEVAAATGTRYSDTCSVLKDGNGALRADYCDGDGIHLNAAGFTAVLNYLRTHAYQ